MASPLPILTFSALNLFDLNASLGTAMRGVDTCLKQRLVGHAAAVPNYRATGSTTTKIPLGNAVPPAAPGSQPIGVLLIRAFMTNDPAADLTVSSRLNFARDGTTLYVFEPAGLTTNTLYDLTFLVFETQ